jgi:predicted nuclease of predicted toxin-antitoxin system
VRLLADLNIAPRTVALLRSLGHDIVRVNELMPSSATDAAIVSAARDASRTIITQDLDFSAIVVLSGTQRPSVISLRLASSRIEVIEMGAIVTVEDERVRVRALPLS